MNKAPVRARPLQALGLAALLGGSGLSHAATVATVDFDLRYDLPSSGAASSAIYVQFYYSLAPGGTGDVATLVFDAVTLGDTDDGRVVTLGSTADDAQLATFFARATNGIDDDFRFDAIGVAGGGTGLVDLESSLLILTTAVTGPDLAGYALTGLELRIADIVIDGTAQPGGFHWQVSGQLRFLGDLVPVPLPGALLLLGSAGGVLAALRRRS